MQNKSDIQILSVCTSDVSGGAARAAYRIHQGVRSLGVESKMFVKHKGSNDPNVHALDEFVPHNPLYRALDWCATKIKNKIQHFQWNQYPNRDSNFKSDLRSTRIHGALQAFDYDVLHLHWINQRFLDLRELSKVNKPIVWTLHDSWPFCGVCHLPMDCKRYESHCGACPMLGSKKEQDLAYEVFEKKSVVYRDLDLHIVTPSNWLADCAKHSTLFGGFPISVIPNCVDSELYKPIEKIKAAEQLGLDSDKKYILFGAINATKDKNKGFDLLVQALHKWNYIGVELLTFGTGENMDLYSLPLPVHSLGYIRNDEVMTHLYNMADVTIVPSRSENLSNTIMESMSCGTPVVAFNIGGNSDMIDHKQNGYLVCENDADDLAQGIQWCLDSNQDNILGKNAREKVLNNYTPEIVCQHYKELYESIL